MGLHSNILLRKLMAAATNTNSKNSNNNNSKEKNESEYEDDEEVVVVGTSTVLDDSAEETTSFTNFQKGKEQLKNVENVINNVSHKMKSKLKVFLSTKKSIALVEVQYIF